MNNPVHYDPKTGELFYYKEGVNNDIRVPINLKAQTVDEKYPKWFIDAKAEALDSFQFDRVQDTMDHLGWKWAHTGVDGGCMSVPTKQQIRETAVYLMDKAFEVSRKNNGDDGVCGSGGLEVLVNAQQKYIRLAFLVGWSEGGDDR